MTYVNEAIIAMVVEGIQVLTSGLGSISHWNEPLRYLSEHLSVHGLVLAQQVSDPNLIGQMQRAWNNFVETGQIWAMLIGIAIGYFLKSMTSF